MGYTIEDMKALGRKRGGDCISDQYRGMNTHLLWRCAEGHEWRAIPSSIRTGHWCPDCYGNKRFTLGDLTKIATSRGGSILSSEFSNRRSVLHWRCAKGHEWRTSAQHVMAGAWCPKCGGSQPLTLTDAIEAAQANGGICLSEVYQNARTRLRWECTLGHRWSTTLAKIRGGQWCPTCRKREAADRLRLTLEEVQKRAAQKGGRCLATSYGGTAGTVLEFECGKQHRWLASPNTIQRSWCPHCAGKIVTLTDIQNIARERGGECLTGSYTNDHTKLSWQCTYGHRWEATPGSIKAGSWCPECATGLGERLCRSFFEAYFAADFSRAYPAWLKLGGRTKLHLDGYNEGLRIAFEHHGRYHYFVDGIYSKDETMLTRRQHLDKLKEAICGSQNVTLIVVPEIPSMLPVDEVRQFILARCSEAGIAVPHPNANPNFIRAYAPDWMNFYNGIAHAQGGRLLSDHYLGAGTKHHWRCGQGHTWKALPNSIQQGSWCPICSGNRITDETKTIRLSELMKVANSRGGTCLAAQYVSCNAKVRWICGEGHEWEATPRNVIVNRSWCPNCWAKRRTKKLKLSKPRGEGGANL